MRYKTISQIIIVMGMLTMSIFATENEKNYYDLTWFELEEAPSAYRFAILPKQPILIGYKGENGKKGETILVKKSHSPKRYEDIVKSIHSLLQKYKLLNLSKNRKKDVFSKELMGQKSMHIRFAYADNSRWSSMYNLDKIPIDIKDFVAEIKELGKEVMKNLSKQIDNESAISLTKEQSADTLLKVKVLSSSKVLVDNEVVSLSELNQILDDFKSIKGTVLYSRESPEKKPSEAMSKSIDSVIEAVINRGLSIKLDR